MLKDILKLEGAQQLTRHEQKSINAGEYAYPCPTVNICYDNSYCCGGYCATFPCDGNKIYRKCNFD